eukprot:810640-Amphidinium_carterae.6
MGYDQRSEAEDERLSKEKVNELDHHEIRRKMSLAHQADTGTRELECVPKRFKTRSAQMSEACDGSDRGKHGSADKAGSVACCCIGRALGLRIHTAWDMSGAHEQDP